MPASIIAPYIISALGVAAGTFAAAAITFGVRLVTTAVVSRMIAKRSNIDVGGAAGQGTQQIGNRVQLSPATDNKIPVVYGTAFMKGIVTDAKISTDQKKMWYVLTFSEAMDSDSVGTLSFGDIYWGDKKLTFKESNTTEVYSWTNSDGTTETQPDGLIHMYLYRDGSDKPINTTQKAYQVLANSSIAEANRWDSSKKMSKLVFAIVEIEYNQEKAITSLPEITAVITNTLNKPGSVIKDYLTNTRYGAGLALSAVNTARLTALDAYSDGTVSYTPSGGGAAVTAPRYRVNGPIDTTKSLLDNLIDLCETCDCWLQWNETSAQWSVVINHSVFDDTPDGSDIRQFGSDNIIGGIDISPIDLNSTYNSVEVQFPNTKIKDQPGYYLVDVSSFPNIRRSPNEPDNRLTLALPFVNNIVQSQYIAGRRLLQSREDLVITFTTDYSGIQVDAGDVIGIHHEQYGWGEFSETVSMPYGKLFRVQQVQEGQSEDGTLFAQITAAEYNDDVYDDNNINLADFEPELNTGITDPTIINTPGTPYTSEVNASAAIPTFKLNTLLPGTGTFAAIEFWYGTTSEMSDSTYRLWSTEYPNQGSFFSNGATVTTTVDGLLPGTYYWRARAVGTRRKSSFSDPTSIGWAPEVISSVVGQNFYATFSPTNLSVARTGTDRIANLTNIQPHAFGILGGQYIPYVSALSDSDPAFVPNSWRIGISSSTNYLDGGVFTATNLTFNYSNVSTGANGSMVITQIDEMTDSPAYIEMSVRYKDAAGNVFQGAPATQQLVFVDNGISFYQPKIWFLAPKTANTATVTGGIYDRTSRIWVERPVTRYGVVGGSLTTVTNYDSPMDVVDSFYRWTAVADDGGSPLTEGTFTAVWNQLPTIEAGFGPTPAFIDFDYAGGTAFYKANDGGILPEAIVITVNAQGINTPVASWSVTGAASYVTSSTQFTRDTVVLFPSTTSTSVQATVSVGPYTKSIILPIVSQGEQGPAGVDGVDGAPGSDATRGFIPLSYIPITVNPSAATQEQLTAAWQSFTGLNPLNRDTATFYYGAVKQSYVYSSSTWVAASQSIDGALVVNGTIRADSLAANEIFTNNLASTGATFAANTSTGYWLDGTTGNARFGGNVSIGGIITSGLLNENIINTPNILIGAVTEGIGTSATARSTYNYPSFNTYYGGEGLMSVTITTTQPNQIIYVFASMNAFVELNTISTPTYSPNILFSLRRYNVSTTAETVVSDTNWLFPDVSSSVVYAGTMHFWPGFTDIIVTPGTYKYYVKNSVASSGGTWSMKALHWEDRSIMVQELKR